MPTLEQTAANLAAKAKGLNAKYSTIAQTFGAALQEYYLRQPDGSLAYYNATPAALQPTIMKLIELSARAQHLMREAGADPRVEPGARHRDVVAYDARLQRYLEIVNDCIAAGRFNDPDCVFYGVTAPLLLGWFPNATEDGIDPKQTRAKLVDAGYAARMLHMAGVRVAADQRNTLAQAIRESAAELPGKTWEASQEAYEAVADALRSAADKLQRWTDPVRRLKAPLLIAAVVGAGYLLYKRKR